MRNEIITSINNLFDENFDIKVRNKYLENWKNQRENMACCSDDIESENKKIIEYGKKKLKDQVISSWRNRVVVFRNDETGEIETTEYNKWLELKISDDEIPKNMSAEEVKKYIYDYAIDDYKKEKEKSIEDFKERERYRNKKKRK